ncbi:hypothetical protein EVAR_4953_1 [Eumeta japonica]|uniref:Uncharacterized protein n=1 Tax=Eumeta variegata TaxID=151549 RepID=A0A4C1V0C9_EUMVA|nr:hypothetical protein EVAR_4953_1 [Eumeta japonica]
MNYRATPRVTFGLSNFLIHEMNTLNGPVKKKKTLIRSSHQERYRVLHSAGSEPNRSNANFTPTKKIIRKFFNSRGALNYAWNSYGVETLTKRILLYVTNHYVYVLCSDEGTRRPCHNV